MFTFLILLQLSSRSEVLASGLQLTTLSAKSPVVQPAPTIFARAENFFVGSSQTCGYIDADVDNPYRCGEDRRCAYVYADDNGGGNWGPFCCDSSDSVWSDCGVAVTTCLDYVDPSHSYLVETQTTSTLFCGLTKSVCATGYLEGDEEDTTSPSYTSYFCATSSSDTFAYQTYDDSIIATTTQSGEPGTLSPSYLTSIPVPAASQTTRITTSTSGLPTEEGNLATPTNVPQQESESGKSNTTAIAGGVGGGVGGLLVLGGCLYAFRMRKKKRDQKNQLPEVQN